MSSPLNQSPRESGISNNSKAERGSRTRWGRGRRDAQTAGSDDADESARGYVPPTLGISPGAEPATHHGSTSSGEEYFVTSPPKKSGLTGNISSLFRRAGSREPGKRDHHRRTGSNGPLPSSNPGSPESSGRKDRLPPAPRSTVLHQAISHGDSPPRPPGGTSRLFYSANQDDDEDSFESREVSSRISQGAKSKHSRAGSEDESGESEVKTILRYRGFSTSIKSLFLDEALVCASMGCFGLILSNRTEYLLQVRNKRRGVRWGRDGSKNTLPSRIVAYALILTFVLIASTFIIWGFGSGDQGNLAESYYDGYDYADESQYSGNSYNNNQKQTDDGYKYQNAANDDANNAKNGYADDKYNYQNQNNANDDANNGGNGGYYVNGYYYKNNDDQNHNDDKYNRRMAEEQDIYLGLFPHRPTGIFKLRDVNEGFWIPAMEYIKEEWNRDPERNLMQKKQKYKSNEKGRDLASDLRISFVFAFLVVLGILGRRRRMRTRYYLVRARAQEDHLFYAAAGAGVKRVAFQDTREDQYEGACSHTLCGCYPTDPPIEGDEVDDEVEVSDEGVTQRKKKPHHEDCVSRVFSCVMASCCGFMCKCWFQCLSICALAQEAREIRLLLPTRLPTLRISPPIEHEFDILSS